MSFMKKLKGLADDFKELLDDKDKPKEQHKPETKPDTSRSCLGSYNTAYADTIR